MKLREMKLQLTDDVGKLHQKAETLARRWLIPPALPEETDADRLRRIEKRVVQEIAMEQLQSAASRGIQDWIASRGPKNAQEFQQYVREYQLRHQEERQEKRPTYTRRPETTKGRKPTDLKVEKANAQPTPKRETVTCYKCGTRGHYARECTEKAFRNALQLSARIIRQGKVNGVNTDRIQVDTGSTLTSVHRKLVAEA